MRPLDGTVRPTPDRSGAAFCGRPHLAEFCLMRHAVESTWAANLSSPCFRLETDQPKQCEGAEDGYCPNPWSAQAIANLKARTAKA